MSVLFVVFEIVGTVAFAVSGVMEGVRRNMDLFGVMMLGLTTAVGGGVIRDVIIGVAPPSVFVHPACAVIALAVSAAGFFVYYRLGTELSPRAKRWGNDVLFAADSLGLAAFTVLGIEATMRVGAVYNSAVLLFVGVITGIGGGILRDVLSGTVPYVFRKHIYALASILGAAVMTGLRHVLSGELAALCGFAAVLAVRVLAFAFKWNLPRVPGKTE